jgi:hypothetical protein
VGRAFGDGQVRHEVVEAGAVPVFFAVGCEDDVAGIEIGDLLSAGLDQAAAFGDVQGLLAVVGMPGGARSGCEADCGDVQLRGRQSAVMGSTLTSPVKFSAGPCAATSQHGNAA